MNMAIFDALSKQKAARHFAKATLGFIRFHVETALEHAPKDEQAELKRTMEDLSDLFDKATEGMAPEALSTTTQLVLAAAHAGACLRYLPETKAMLAKLARAAKKDKAGVRDAALDRVCESLGRKPSVETLRRALEKQGIKAPGRNKLQAVIKRVRGPVDKSAPF